MMNNITKTSILIVLSSLLFLGCNEKNDPIQESPKPTLTIKKEIPKETTVKIEAIKPKEIIKIEPKKIVKPVSYPTQKIERISSTATKKNY